MPLAATPGMRQRQVDAGSARPSASSRRCTAASASSSGIARKKPSISHAVNGIFSAVYAMIMPGILLISPTLANRMNRGRLSATPGTARASIMLRKTAFLPRKLQRANT